MSAVQLEHGVSEAPCLIAPLELLDLFSPWIECIEMGENHVAFDPAGISRPQVPWAA